VCYSCCLAVCIFIGLPLYCEYLTVCNVVWPCLVVIGLLCVVVASSCVIPVE
jgi:hypothetical protein